MSPIDVPQSVAKANRGPVTVTPMSSALPNSRRSSLTCSTERSTLSRGWIVLLKDWMVRLAGRGARRETALVGMLDKHLWVKHRLDWELSREAPHFYDF